jgi:6-phosphofructokinase 1
MVYCCCTGSPLSISGKDHAVIVVAEGAGQRHVTGDTEEKDASGNVLKKDIGEYLKQRISQHLKKTGREGSVKVL